MLALLLGAGLSLQAGAQSGAGVKALAELSLEDLMRVEVVSAGREAERIAVRDYFRVEDDAGERLWIFRAGDGEDAATGSHRWFLHGVFG